MNSKLIAMMEIYDENFMRLFLSAEASEEIQQWTEWCDVEDLVSRCVNDVVSVDKITRSEWLNN